MGILASDQDNAAFVGAVPDTSGLGVRFYRDVRKNDFQSDQQKRPIYEEVLMIHIVIPGNNLFDVKEVVQERHKQRFPLQWAAFQNSLNGGGDPMMVGTPLDQWPLIGRAQAEELKALKFFTVESIAQASDAVLARMGLAAGMAPHALRDRAIRFLDLAKEDASANKQAEEIERLRIERTASDERHAAQLTQMQQQIDALAQASKDKPRPVARRKRKYTRKAKAQAAQAAA
jgi:hypothetical protein